jgi:predicted transcriptional regulator
VSKYGISVKEYVQPRPFSSRGFVSKYLKRKRNAQEKIEKKKKNNDLPSEKMKKIIEENEGKTEI